MHLKTESLLFLVLCSGSAWGIGGAPCGTQEQCDLGHGYGLDSRGRIMLVPPEVEVEKEEPKKEKDCYSYSVGNEVTVRCRNAS